MKALSIENEDPIVALESLSNTVALEAFSLRGVANRLADILPSMTHAFRQYAYTHRSDKLDLTPPNINLLILNKALTSANYLDMAKFAVAVPQGHVGNMVDFMAATKEAVEFSNGIVDRMTAFNQLVSALISSPQARNSTRDLSTATTQIESERKALLARLGESSRANSRAARRPLEVTYRSMGEIKMACELSFDIVARAAQLNLTSINSLINDAVELLDEFERRALEGTITDLTPQMYKSLASSTLTMARDAEFHALLCYKAWEIKDCLEITSKELIKALRY